MALRSNSSRRALFSASILSGRTALSVARDTQRVSGQPMSVLAKTSTSVPVLTRLQAMKNETAVTELLRIRFRLPQASASAQPRFGQ